jgi:hypothetical protein
MQAFEAMLFENQAASLRMSFEEHVHRMDDKLGSEF